MRCITVTQNTVCRVCNLHSHRPRCELLLLVDNWGLKNQCVYITAIKFNHLDPYMTNIKCVCKKHVDTRFILVLEARVSFCI